MAIAGATGISSGSAFTICSLLFDDGDENLFTSLARPRFRRFSTVNGVRCHRISGINRVGWRIEIHVGVDDLVVRRWVKRAGRFSYAEMRTDIAVDANLDGTDFTIFDAPVPGAS